jgi:hypothetical protein
MEKKMNNSGTAWRTVAVLVAATAVLTASPLAAGGLATGSAHPRNIAFVTSPVSQRPADDSDGDPDPNRQPGGGAYGPYTCKLGFVWRDSYEGDHLCVSPAGRQKAHADNPDRQPGGGAYGSYTCKPGFVWRDSYDGDYACVSPHERREEKREAGRS